MRDAGQHLGQGAVAIGQPSQAGNRIVRRNFSAAEYDHLIRHFFDQFRHRRGHHDRSRRLRRESP